MKRPKGLEQAPRPIPRAATAVTTGLITVLITGLITVLAVGLALIALLGQFGAWRHDLDALSAVRPQASIALLILAVALAMLGARRVATAALAIAGYGLITLGPVWSVAAPAGAGCPLRTLRVAIANIQAVGGSTAHFSAIEASVRAQQADIVALVEASPRFFDAAPGLLRDLPYTVGRKGRWGAIIYARFPLTDRTTRPWPDGAPIHALAEVDLGGTALAVGAFHLSRPIIGPQEREVSEIGPLTATLPPRRIILGDFNAAPWSHAVREIEASASVRVAPGFMVTWRGVYPNPVFDLGAPALYGAQIDHVMASPDIAIRRQAVFDAPGSDHWGVVADLDVPIGASGADCR